MATSAIRIQDYTASQLAVLRYLLRSRRAWEASRRVRPAPETPAEAGAQRLRPPDEGDERGGGSARQ
jgi:hypothetical protein